MLDSDLTQRLEDYVFDRKKQKNKLRAQQPSNDGVPFNSDDDCNENDENDESDDEGDDDNDDNNDNDNDNDYDDDVDNDKDECNYENEVEDEDELRTFCFVNHILQKKSNFIILFVKSCLMIISVVQVFAFIVSNQPSGAELYFTRLTELH